MSTKPPNHYYPAAGMQIVDSNYDLSEQNVNCILGGNGWCVFGGSNTATKILLTAHPIGHNPKNIGLPGTEQITLKLALDAQGNTPISMQTITTTSTTSGRIIGYVYGWQTPPSAASIAAAGYTHVLIAFGIFSTNAPGTINIDSISGFNLTNYIQSLHQSGLKVLLSLGGASTNIPNTTVYFDQAVQLAANPGAFETTFVNSLQTLVNTYGFDGFDIDIEHGLNAAYSFSNPSLNCNNTTFDSKCSIFYLSTVINNFHSATGYTNQLITFAPQIANISATPNYSEIWGNYASLLSQQSICNATGWVGFQNYNTGTAYGINGVIYPIAPANVTSTADAAVVFATDLLESWPQTPFGFGTFQPYVSCLSPSQVVVGYVVNNNAGVADGAPAVIPSVAKNVIQCLRTGQLCGTYVPPRTYPGIGGVFAWSINYDATTNYQFATSMYPCVIDGNCS